MSLYNGLNITQLAIESVDRRVMEDGLEFDGNLTLVQTVVSEVVQEIETQREMSETEYEQFLADVWVGVVLTLMVLSCVCCMCSCLLYHKFQQWKRRVLDQRASAASRDPDYRGGDTESLPSYTLVSGLPSYDEALEQLKQVHALRRGIDHVVIFDCSGNSNDKQQLAAVHQVAAAACGTAAAAGSETDVADNNSLTNHHNIISNHCSYNVTTQNNCNQMSRLSVADLLQIYKIQQQQQQQIGTCSSSNHGVVKI